MWLNISDTTKIDGIIELFNIGILDQEIKNWIIIICNLWEISKGICDWIFLIRKIDGIIIELSNTGNKKLNNNYRIIRIIPVFYL